MKIVGSSTISDIDYVPDVWKLIVTFISGEHYSYQPVYATTHTQLMNAESKGEYFAKHIRNNKKLTIEKLGKTGGTRSTITMPSVLIKNDNKTRDLEAKETRKIHEISRDFHKLLRSKT